MKSIGSLEETHPELATEWHPTMNGQLSPREIKAFMTRKVWWKCKTGITDHVWEASVRNRTHLKAGCPCCAGRKIVKSNCLATVNPSLAAEWHPTKNGKITPYDVGRSYNKNGINVKFWWICKNGHEWQSNLGNRIRGRNCRKCSLKRTSWQETAILFKLKKIFEIDSFDNLIETPEKNYQVDIKIKEKNLIVEFDGEYFHRNKMQKDTEKTKFLKRLNWEVLRIRERPLEPVLDCSVLIDPLYKYGDQSVWLNHAMNRILPYMLKKGYITPLDQEIARKNTDNSELLEFFTIHKRDHPNSIKTKKPELMKYWDFKRNDVDPGKLTVGSNFRAFFICDKDRDHKWSTTINSYGKGCPFCNRQRISQSNCLETTHPKVAAYWHHTKNRGLTPREVMSGTCKKFWWICRNGHEFKSTVYQMVRAKSNPCIQCSSLVTTHPQLAKQWHKEKNREILVTLCSSGSDKKVWWRCEYGHEWKQKINARTSSSGVCPRCDLDKNSLAAKSPDLVKWWHEKKNKSLKPSDVKPTSMRSVWWRCPEGHEFQRKIGYMTNRCKLCSLSILSINSRVHYKGTWYSSYIDLGKAVGVSGNTIISRVRLGWSIDRAVETKNQNVTYKGKTYNSNKQLAEEYGVEYSTFLYRIKSNWTLEEALGVVDRKRSRQKGKEIICAGEHYDSISALSEKYKVEYFSLKARLRRGWTPEQAVGLKEHKRKAHNRKSIQVKGRNFPSLTDAALSFGLPPKRVELRLRRGWSVEEAFEIKIRDRKSK